jgi:hypothetical protein
MPQGMANDGFRERLPGVGIMGGHGDTGKIRRGITKELTWNLLPVADLDGVGVEGDAFESQAVSG